MDVRGVPRAPMAPQTLAESRRQQRQAQERLESLTDTEVERLIETTPNVPSTVMDFLSLSLKSLLAAAAHREMERRDAPTVGSPTPWGPAQHIQEMAPGIVLVSTASHGGFWVNPTLNVQVPALYRAYAARWSHGSGDHWYEEDCCACAIPVTFPGFFEDDVVDSCRRTLQVLSREGRM